MYPGSYVDPVDLAECIFGWGRDGLLVMLTCYGDESIDVPQQRVLCVGSLLAWPKAAHDSSLDWIKRLDKDHISFFHAAECDGLYGEFEPAKLGVSNLNSARAIADSVQHDLLDILCANEGLGAVGLAVKLPEFREVIATSAKARHYWGSDPIVFAYRQLVGTTVQLLHEDWPDLHLPIAFTFDEHRAWREAEEACAKLKQEEQIFEDMIGHVGHDDDKKIIPLQMADLVALEARFECDAHLKGFERHRRQFKALQGEHMIYYIGWVGKQHMLDKLAELPDV